MRKQEIFDTVVRHLFRQGKQSIGRDGMCRYRLGAKACAVGALIPDALYSQHLEGMSAEQLMTWTSADEMYPTTKAKARSRLCPSIAKLLGKANTGLVGALQDAHDVNGNWRNTHDGKTTLLFIALDNVATDYKLNRKVLREFATFTFPTKKKARAA